MNREYHKWHSDELRRDMEMLVFGQAGKPMVVFPTSMGRFFEYEDRGMIQAIRNQLGRSALHAFCVDSVDSESWYNKNIAPRERVLRHNQYERYIIEEVIPFMRLKNPSRELIVTGCSFGGYHAVNFALKHPDLVTYCVSMGGRFDIHAYLDGYYDEDCYFNCPVDYLQNLTDEWYLDHYRNHVKIVLATGEHDLCLDANITLSRIMNDKMIPHWLDIWGDHTGHDWPWWQRMAGKFF